MQNHEQVTDEFKGQILKEFEIKVRSKMNIAKRVDLRKQKKRTDIESFKFVFSLDDYDNYHSPLH